MNGSRKTNPDKKNPSGRRERVDVGTLHATSLHHPQDARSSNIVKPSRDHLDSAKNEYMALISPKPRSLSTILRSYKAAVTRHARRLGFAFGWQGRFHDHIIRDDEEYQRIVDYIVNNPANWKDDEFFS